jgi:cytochrome P450
VTLSATPLPTDRLDAVLGHVPEAVKCPFPAYKSARDEGDGVYHDEAQDIYVVTRAEHVDAVLTQPRLFSSAQPMGPGVSKAVEGAQHLLAEDASPEMVTEMVARAETMGERGGVLFTVDPPEHTRHRKLLGKAMSPKVVSSIEPDVEAEAKRLIDDFPADGAVEFMDRFAEPVPLFALAKLLGVPESMGTELARWSSSVNAPIGRDLTPEELRVATDSQLELWEYFEGEFAARTSGDRNGDDLLTHIIEARLEDERPFDTDERIGIATSLISAGGDTTTRLLALAICKLCEEPSLFSLLKADRTRLPDFIEEVLRLESPVQGLFRLTTEDTSIGDVKIPKGKFVWVLYASANRDERAVENPDAFDLCRGRNRHYAFGHGPHSCMGQALARSTARIALDGLIERFDGVRFEDPDNPPELDPSSFVLRGFVSLPVRFQTMSAPTPAAK